MSLLHKTQRHIAEASYLYGFANSLRDTLALTWFLMKRKGAQLSARLDAPHAFAEDALVPLYGARHVVDLAGTEIYVLDEIYREHLYERLAGFAPRAGSTVVDAGANVGMFAIQHARRGAQVYAFEPNRACYRRLSKAVVANDLTARISIFNYALGQTTGLGVLHVPHHQTVYGSVQPWGGSGAGDEAMVRMTTLDHILPALGVGHVDVLKIDTEGAEVAVLQGAEQVLQTTDRIVVEYHSRELQGQVAAFCRGHGFRQALDIPTSALPESGLLYAEKVSL